MVADFLDSARNRDDSCRITGNRELMNLALHAWQA